MIDSLMEIRDKLEDLIYRVNGLNRTRFDEFRTKVSDISDDMDKLVCDLEEIIERWEEEQ